MKNVQFCSRSRKTKILIAGLPLVFRGLKFESDAEIGQKGMLFTTLRPLHNRTKVDVKEVKRAKKFFMKAEKELVKNK